MKTCTVCKVDLPIERFSKRAMSKDGYSPRCKGCAKISGAAYYLKNQELIKARTKAWAENHPEERASEKARYRARHRETIRQKFRAWYAENAATDRARCAAYHAKYPHVAGARGKRWTELNPEASRAKSMRRRALKRMASGSHTGEDIARLLAAQRRKCAGCRSGLDDGYHVDHIVALASGGSNDAANLQILCGRCNRRKGKKHPGQFMRELGYLI